MTQETDNLGSLALAIGSAIWIYDVNCRVYAKDAAGRSHGGPLYRESWREEPIIGETKKSWLIGPGWKPRKIPKKGPHNYVCFSLAELEGKCWENDNRHRLSEKVRGATLSQLRRIDAILSEQNGADETRAGARRKDS